MLTNTATALAMPAISKSKRNCGQEGGGGPLAAFSNIYGFHSRHDPNAGWHGNSEEDNDKDKPGQVPACLSSSYSSSSRVPHPKLEMPVGDNDQPGFPPKATRPVPQPTIQNEKA